MIATRNNNNNDNNNSNNNNNNNNNSNNNKRYSRTKFVSNSCVDSSSVTVVKLSNR